MKNKIFFIISFFVFISLLTIHPARAGCGCDCEKYWIDPPTGDNYYMCYGARVEISLASWQSCTVGAIPAYQWTEDSGESCTSSGSVCHTGYCPNWGSNKDRCYVNYDFWAIITCVCESEQGIWDESDGACIRCDGRTEDIRLADTSDIYPSDNSGDGQCESACDASSVCDETPISPATYFCISDCDGHCEGYCSSCLYYTDGCEWNCGADLACDEYNPREQGNCPDNSCSQIYNDYCDPLKPPKLKEYDMIPDCIDDSTTVTDSCSNSCQDDCICSNCLVACPSPPTVTHCCAGECGAECDFSDLSGCTSPPHGTCDSISCSSNCACQYALVCDGTTCPVGSADYNTYCAPDCDQYDRGYPDSYNNPPNQGQCSGYDYSSYTDANQMRDYFVSDSACDCDAAYDSYITSVCSDGTCSGDVSFDTSENIEVTVTVLNTGTLGQGWWFVGVEFWWVEDYNDPWGTRSGVVNAWYDNSDGSHGCDIAGCDCSSPGGVLLSGGSTTVNCYIPASQYGETAGNQRVMLWVHERDSGQDAGNNGNAGNDWWIDALTRELPASLRASITSTTTTSTTTTSTTTTSTTTTSTTTTSTTTTASGECSGCDYCFNICNEFIKGYCGDGEGCDCFYEGCNNEECPCSGCDVRFTCCEVGDFCDCDEECPRGVECYGEGGTSPSEKALCSQITTTCWCGGPPTTSTTTTTSSTTTSSTTTSSTTTSSTTTSSTTTSSTTTSSTTTTAVPECGDDNLDSGEVCDDGNTIDCDGCKGDCLRFDDICGDGIVECGEGCDPGPPMNWGTCRYWEGCTAVCTCYDLPTGGCNYVDNCPAPGPCTFGQFIGANCWVDTTDSSYRDYIRDEICIDAYAQAHVVHECPYP